MRTANIYVRRVGSGEAVKTIEVPLPISEGKHERLLMGLLRNMADDYFVDDSELDNENRGS